MISKLYIRKIITEIIKDNEQLEKEPMRKQ